MQAEHQTDVQQESNELKFLNAGPGAGQVKMISKMLIPAIEKLKYISNYIPQELYEVCNL